MRSKAILEELKAKAYNGEAAALGDALGDMVHWLAAHREEMQPRDAETLMTVCLALYKNELEKSWDISVHDIPEASVAAGIGPAKWNTHTDVAFYNQEVSSARAIAATAAASATKATTAATAAMSATATVRQTDAENAIEAMVALRRPAALAQSDGTANPASGAPRRRWTDSGCWSLTLRTA